MTEPMSPEDVDQVLVDAATFAFAARSLGSDDTDFTAYTRAMLAAVLPLHAEQLGETLGKLTFPCLHHTAPHYGVNCISCSRYAALIGARRIIEGRDRNAQAVRQMRSETSPAAEQSGHDESAETPRDDGPTAIDAARMEFDACADCFSPITCSEADESRCP